MNMSDAQINFITAIILFATALIPLVRWLINKFNAKKMNRTTDTNTVAFDKGVYKFIAINLCLAVIGIIFQFFKNEVTMESIFFMAWFAANVVVSVIGLLYHSHFRFLEKKINRLIQASDKDDIYKSKP
jgi:uncharacterized membrane protein